MSAMARVRRRARIELARRGMVGASFESRLTWVFGSPRSGSTWLYLMLGDHPSVVPINEPLIGNYLGPFVADQPGSNPRELDLSTFTLGRLRDVRDQFFSSEFTDVWQPGLRRLLRSRFYAHAVRHPARVPLARTAVVVKEPNGSQSADMLMAATPRARLLFLLRDGRDVVDSDLAAHLKGSWATREFSGIEGLGSDQRLDYVVRSSYKWLWRTEVVQSAVAAHPDRSLTLRYEDLLTDTTARMRDLYAWMGVPLDHAALRASVERHAFSEIPAEHRGAESFFRAASPGLWRENLTGAEQEAMLEILGPKLAELGYAV